jgi:hyperosmotically inducible protein
MNLKKLVYEALVVAAIGVFAACSDTPKSPDVADSIKQNLKSAGFNDVSVSQDRDKGVVTLTGTTPTDADKAQAESIARSIAGNQVVSDQIAVRPTGDEGVAKKVDSDLDKAIEKNFDAVLLQNHLDKNVKYEVKVGVVTLTGDVSSQSKRAYVEKLAAGVPNVRQVVNELEVKNQKATASTMN